MQPAPQEPVMQASLRLLRCGLRDGAAEPLLLPLAVHPSESRICSAGAGYHKLKIMRKCFRSDMIYYQDVKSPRGFAVRALYTEECCEDARSLASPLLSTSCIRVVIRLGLSQLNQHRVT